MTMMTLFMPVSFVLVFYQSNSVRTIKRTLFYYLRVLSCICVFLDTAMHVNSIALRVGVKRLCNIIKSLFGTQLRPRIGPSNRQSLHRRDRCG